MRQLHTYSLLTCIVVIGLLLVGCQKLPDGMPKPYPVTIQITSEGKPLPGVSVALFPEDTSSRWGGGGTTDAVGTISVRTLGQYNGIPAGKYALTISMVETEEKSSVRGGDPYAYYNLIDPKFSDMENPAVWIDVEKKSNKFVQDVGPQVRVKIP